MYDVIQLIMIILFSVGTVNIVEMLNIFNILTSIIGCSTYTIYIYSSLTLADIYKARDLALTNNLAHFQFGTSSKID